MRAAIYARYSSDNQRQESIEAQLRAIELFAKENNLIVVEVYIDEAKSATSDQRPYFQRMIKDAENGLFDTVIVHKLDRFARDRYDSIFYRRKLKNVGVNLTSVTEKLDGTPESVILESLLEGMSEYYSRNLSRECMKGLMENAHKCLTTGGRPPFGYDIDPITKEYVINNQEAIAVNRIFNDYMEGKSYQDIISWLNNSGYKSKKGGEFLKNSLHSLLKNEKYIGVYVFNRSSRSKYDQSHENVIRVEDGVPAIVSKETFFKVQQRLDTNKIRSQIYKAETLYVLSGKVYCGECGSKMSGNRRKSKAGNIWSGYQCSGRKKKNGCMMPEFKKEKLEELVLNHLEKEVFSEEFIDALCVEILKVYQSQRSVVADEIDVLKGREKEITKQIENVVTAIVQGYSSRVLQQKLEDLENAAAEVKLMIQQIEIKNQSTLTFQDIKKYLSIGKGIAYKHPREQMQIIDVFLDKVVVNKEDLDIHFSIDNLKKKRGYVGAPYPYSFVSTLNFIAQS